jgi:aryl-alcohol dehydrogenase-like predicted oxidoreductase
MTYSSIQLACESYNQSHSLYDDNEELIGKWFKRTNKRNQIFLATKFGYVTKGGLKIDSSYEYCKQACDKSLKTLGIDCIDLCLSPFLADQSFLANIPSSRLRA